MNHVVSQRFIQCVVELKKRNVVRSARQFALQVNYLPQSLNEILKGRRDVTIDLIHKCVQTFQISPHFLFIGEGPMFSFEARDKGLRIHTVVTNNEGEEKIIHVPIPAQADYAANALSVEAVKNLESYHLPGFKSEDTTYRSFEMKGDSMYPTVEPTDVLVCECIDPSDWSAALSDEKIYCLVSNNDVLVKRVINRLEREGLLQLHSDNTSYKPILIHEEELREIWQPKYLLKRFIPQQSLAGDAQESSDMEIQDVLERQQKILHNLQEQINDLMNQRKHIK